MRKSTIISFLFFLCFIILPLSIFAQDSHPCTGLITCGCGSQPPCNFNDALALVNKAIKAIGIFSVIVATISFTIAGARILLNPDNPSERENAKKMFKKTVYGMFFLMGAFLIVKLIVEGFGVEGDIYGPSGIFRWLKF